MFSPKTNLKILKIASFKLIAVNLLAKLSNFREVFYQLHNYLLL